MKLVVIMSVEAYAEALEKIYAAHRVPVFSEVDIRGYLGVDAGSVIENWFGKAHAPVYSKLTFAFVSAGKADELLAAIEEFNSEKRPESPVRAFLLNVERHV